MKLMVEGLKMKDIRGKKTKKVHDEFKKSLTFDNIDNTVIFTDEQEKSLELIQIIMSRLTRNEVNNVLVITTDEIITEVKGIKENGKLQLTAVREKESEPINNIKEPINKIKDVLNENLKPKKKPKKFPIEDVEPINNIKEPTRDMKEPINNIKEPKEGSKKLDKLKMIEGILEMSDSTILANNKRMELDLLYEIVYGKKANPILPNKAAVLDAIRQKVK